MQVDINEILEMYRRRREINAVDLRDIQWMNGDKPVEIPADIIEHWRFIGMTNCCFIETGYYKNGESEMITEMYITTKDENVEQ